MARTDTLGHFLTDVADAIRTKTGSSDTIQASDFDEEIENIPSGGVDTRWQEIGYTSEPGSINNNYLQAKEIYDNWDTTITSTANMFSDSSINPSSYFFTIFPNVDTSNITAMNRMFYNNYFIEEIGEDFDFSKSTTCQEMFYFCYNLKKIGDVLVGSNTNMKNMFTRCYSLKFINIVRIAGSSSSSVFYVCHNLTINKVLMSVSGNTDKIFDTCNNLDIKEFVNEGNANWNKKLFNSCTLTNDTLLATLKYAKTLTGRSTKTLYSLGLSQTEAELCETFDDWEELEESGWTTGY